jgi:hypothetical protein
MKARSRRIGFPLSRERQVLIRQKGSTMKVLPYKCPRLAGGGDAR